MYNNIRIRRILAVFTVFAIIGMMAACKPASGNNSSNGNITSGPSSSITGSSGSSADISSDISSDSGSSSSFISDISDINNSGSSSIEYSKGSNLNIVNTGFRRKTADGRFISDIPRSRVKETLSFTSSKFNLKIDSTGTVSSFASSDGKQLLNKSVDNCFTLNVKGKGKIVLDRVYYRGEYFAFSDVNEIYCLTLKIKQTSNYISFTIADFSGNLPAGSYLSINLGVSTPIYGFPFDYSTSDYSDAKSIMFKFDRIWERDPSNPLGGFAYYYSTTPDEQDEAIMRIWGGEAVPHPKVSGTWDYNAAKRWVDNWCNTFADQSTMYLTGKNVDELKQFKPYLDMADIKMVYLFSGTWQDGNFWPVNTLNWQIGPGGTFNTESNFNSYSTYLNQQNRLLSIHYLTAAIGLNDPKYGGKNLTDQLASWVDGSLVEFTSGSTLIFKPAKSWYVMPQNTIGQSNDPNYTHPIGSLTTTLNKSVYPYNYLQVGKEMMKITGFTDLNNGTWEISVGSRGINNTTISQHATGTLVKGLILPYNCVYAPANNSSFIKTVATEFANMLNRNHVYNTTYDGAEDQEYDGEWGFNKFATLVYQNLDHPVIAHTSHAYVPKRGYIEYQLNRVKKYNTAPKGDHNAGRASLTLERINPSLKGMYGMDNSLVPASQLLSANYMLSQTAAMRGENFSIIRPDQPHFSLTLEEFKTYGRTQELLTLLPKWKAVSKKLTDLQCQTILNSLSSPSQTARPSSDVCFELRETETQYQLFPMQLMARENVTELKFRMMQEAGPFPAVQKTNMGITNNMKNAYLTQTPQFIIRNTTGNTGSIKNPSIKIGSNVLKVNGSIEPSQYVEYRGGVSAKIYDKNWNLLSTVSVSDSGCIAQSGYNSVTISSDNDSKLQVELQLMTQGDPILVNK